MAHKDILGCKGLPHEGVITRAINCIAINNVDGTPNMNSIQAVRELQELLVSLNLKAD